MPEDHPAAPVHELQAVTRWTQLPDEARGPSAFRFVPNPDAGLLWIAMCSCGMGSPPKPSEDEARASLAVHLHDPREYPR